MKNYRTLKVFILITLTSTSLFSVSLSSSEIVKMVEEIKKERKGVLLSTLENTGNPFVIQTPKRPVSVDGVVTEVEVVYTLKAILNKAAFINNKWYKNGDKLGKYRVGYITSSSVLLKSPKGNKKLSLKKKNKNFIKLNRGYK